MGYAHSAGARAREQSGHGLDVLPPLRAQRPLWIHLLREGIAVLDEIEPHSPYSLQTTHRLLSTRL
jgi:hypothetical protein